MSPWLRPLVGPRFQVLFHSPPGVLFTFPSRYYTLSVAAEYSALEGGPPCFRRDSSCPGVLRQRAQRHRIHFAYGALTRSGRPSQTVPLCMRRAPGPNPRRTPTTPRPRRPAVWAPPRSLAATGGISFDFFSCRYLDGSLPCVSPRGAYVFSTAARGLLRADYSIRAPGDLGMSAPPPGFSQLAAPFLAWRLPGILREPFLRLTISSFPSSRSTVKKPSTGGRGVRTPDPRLAKPMP
jgi:hypothetical protein